LVLAYQALKESRQDGGPTGAPLEEEIDVLTEDYRKNPIRRLNEGKCNGSNGAYSWYADQPGKI
jgi:hypothetical protein